MASTSRMLAEELVAEAFALARRRAPGRRCRRTQPRRDDLGRLAELRELVEARIGHRHPADVRLDGAERIVRGLRRRGPRQRVEEGRLADVRQADDAAAETHEVLSDFRVSRPKSFFRPAKAPLMLRSGLRNGVRLLRAGGTAQLSRSVRLAPASSALPDARGS